MERAILAPGLIAPVPTQGLGLKLEEEKSASSIRSLGPRGYSLVHLFLSDAGGWDHRSTLRYFLGLWLSVVAF